MSVSIPVKDQKSPFFALLEKLNMHGTMKTIAAIILIIGIFHLWLAWPGILSPDSQTQYAIALSGNYSDHHPPLMSFVWRYLNKIYPGPGMMLLLHLSLLYGSIFYLMRSVTTFSYRFLLIALPFIPQVFIYSHMIWKDVGFAFSFLFAASYLSYLTSNKRKPSFFQTSILLIVLFYGTAIKFQAQYCAPILLGWLAYLFSNHTICSRKFVRYFFMLLVSFFLLLHSVNHILIKNEQKNHSWQYVKLYDLAAISIANNASVFPDFTKNNNFTMEELFKRFTHQRVDDLVFVDPLLKIGRNEEERQALYSAWLNAVYHHPLAYLKHRMLNLANIVLYPPGFSHIQTSIEKISSKGTLPYTLLHQTAKIIAFLTMSHVIPIMLGLLYFIFGLSCLRISWAAIPLVSFNALGLAMTFVLFFCSMAGTPRYTYISICMLHASHIFAYLCFNARWLKNLPQSTSVLKHHYL